MSSAARCSTASRARRTRIEAVSDDADRAGVVIERGLELTLAAARAPIAAGVPGECDDCGRAMPRLVGGRCGFCRDGRKAA